MTPALKKISITSGDPDGVGLEVSIKALNKIGFKKSMVFFLNRSHRSDKELKKLDKNFSRVTVASIQEGLDFLSSRKAPKNILFDVRRDDGAPAWVQDSAEFCTKKLLDGIVTAPMSKTLIRDSGFRDLGHTEILQRVANVKSVHMGFVGDKFNVVLATGHVSINQVSQHLTSENLQSAIVQAHQLSKMLKLSNRPIGMLGLNPHAGERGLIGIEENSVINGAMDWARKQNIKLAGPLVPDAAFFPENWTRFSCYLACYHDQGLIPFKMIHGQDSGCHISLGLPFVRTSVDHGTAKDIFGKNKANPKSMIFALSFCLKLV